MFGQDKPVVLERYGKRRSRWSVHPWLVLLLAGIALGAGGVVYVQENHLPPRLSAGESATLRASFEQADRERQRLTSELGSTAKRLDSALADSQRLTQDLATSREAGERLRGLTSALVASLPPDPRGGAIEIRAARFTVDGAALAYDVVLTRERAGSTALKGVMQLIVSGASGRGTDTSATLAPVNISVGPFETLRGSVPLPEGFKPRQATIQLLDRLGGKLLGQRVLYVK